MAAMGHEDAFPPHRSNAGYVIGKETVAWARGSGRDAPKALAGTRVDLRNPKFEWRADPPLYRGLRERCRNGGGMDAGVVAYSREPRRVELREQSRRPLAAINKVVGEIVDEDPDRWSQSSAGREYKMKGNFLRAPTGEYPNQASFSDRSHHNFSR